MREQMNEIYLNFFWIHEKYSYICLAAGVSKTFAMYDGGVEF